MNTFYLHQESAAKNLILYFNGWAMTEAAIAHLSIPESTNILVCQDYRSIDFHPPCDLSNYQRIYLVAWSMGVWAAELVFSQGLLPPIDKAVSIAGTALPISDEEGIPERIFRATLNNISEENRMQFNRRMCGGKSLKHLFESLSKRSTEEIREELQMVEKISMNNRKIEDASSKALSWSKALIPNHDLIIPPANQMRHWLRRGVPTEDVLGEHYLLNRFSTWDEII